VGAYSFFVVDNLDEGIGLCLASAYLLVSRISWCRLRVRRDLQENPLRLGPVELDLAQEGIKVSAGASEFRWSVALRYYETRDLFLLLGPDKELCILPKRAFPVGDMLQWTERLRTELKGKGRRDNPDALLLKLTATSLSSSDAGLPMGRAESATALPLRAYREKTNTGST
jgi:hypothetical protein